MKTARNNRKPAKPKQRQDAARLARKQKMDLLGRFAELGASVEAAFTMLNLLSEKSRQFFDDGLGEFGETYHGGIVHLACGSADKLQADFEALYQEMRPLLVPKASGGVK